jgi:cytochrome c biogenesis protein CcdA
MMDATAMSISAVTSHSPLALASVFAAGVLTSFGPCVAPRYLAVTAMANASNRPALTIGAFLAGLTGAYVVLGFAAGLLGSLWSISSSIDIVLAVSLLLGGSFTLVRARAPHASGTCAHIRSKARLEGSIGGTALVGAATALVISPCCAPIIVAIVATSSALGTPVAGAALLAAFALGHAVPLFFSGVAGSFVMQRFARFTVSQAPAVIAGTLMLALGCYYAVLA